ncbi:MAG TPA: zf-TFIIB domain-containing protein [Myxococcales bacterium LLY-WYZ-16_1]|nr:zf-TFIIB domain-containing protein [Myxococcales bacterium LLY-WYZ-16_1]
MKCPRTGEPMKEVEIQGIKVDISTGCGGVWFDNFELAKFDEPFECAGETLLEACSPYIKEDIDTAPRLQSPRHPDITMMRRSFSVKRRVEVDECPKCGGIWLDPGELHAIRSLFPGEEAKNQAADQHFEMLFQSPEIQAMRAESQASLKRAQRFAGLFRFLCPSYYIPGKQNWGAF